MSSLSSLSVPARIKSRAARQAKNIDESDLNQPVHNSYHACTNRPSAGEIGEINQSTYLSNMETWIEAVFSKPIDVHFSH
jgi:hypothetical protein